jgi:ABC-2 type transport system permease protein
MQAKPVVMTQAGSAARTWQHVWLIGRRAAVESLRDRATLVSSAVFVIVLPAVFVFAFLGPMAARAHTAEQQMAFGVTVAVYFLIIGLLPANGAVGVACGQFAGEKERGCLTPMLASPASNIAIFGGKVLGAVLPAVLYSALAEVAFLVELSVSTGTGTLRLIPLPIALSMLALVPGVAVLCAGVAALISSRVRTYNAASQITSLALLPVMAGIVVLSIAVQAWEPLGPVVVVLAFVAADVVLIVLSATTWRREEVLARQ